MHAFSLPHAPHIGRQFSESSGTSNTLLSLVFGILLILRLILLGFFDTDFADCGIDRKSTSATCHFLISSLVCRSAHKQSYVTQSTTEAEYVAAAPRYFG
jgi:hypothetical protein